VKKTHQRRCRPLYASGACEILALLMTRKSEKKVGLLLIISMFSVPLASPWSLTITGLHCIGCMPESLDTKERDTSFLFVFNDTSINTSLLLVRNAPASKTRSKDRKEEIG